MAEYGLAIPGTGGGAGARAAAAAEGRGPPGGGGPGRDTEARDRQDLVPAVLADRTRADLAADIMAAVCDGACCVREGGGAVDTRPPA